MTLTPDDKARIDGLAQALLKNASVFGEPLPHYYVAGLKDAIESAIEKELVPLPHRRRIQALPPEKQGAAIGNELQESIAEAIETWFELEGVKRGAAQ